MNLSLTELIVGFCIQIPFFYVLGLWVLPLCFLSGFAWAYGGGGNPGGKLIRRVGVPVLTAVALWIGTGHWLAALGVIPGILACCLGYGQSSWLFCLFYNGKNQGVADYLTRMTTYFIYWAGFALSLFVASATF